MVGSQSGVSETTGVAAAMYASGNSEQEPKRDIYVLYVQMLSSKDAALGKMHDYQVWMNRRALGLILVNGLWLSMVTCADRDAADIQLLNARTCQAHAFLNMNWKAWIFGVTMGCTHLCLGERACPPTAALQAFVQGDGQLGLNQGRQSLPYHLQHIWDSSFGHHRETRILCQ